MGWMLSFSCSILDVVALLNDQASEMENDLENWMKEVEDKRSQFYELNYFTTPQLLSLCEELGQCKSVVDQHKPIKSEVMTLLQSISRELTASDVKEQVQIVRAILQSFSEQQLLNGPNKPKQSPSIPLPPQSNASTNLTTQTMEYTDIHHQRSERYNDDVRNCEMKSKEITSNVPEPQLKYEELTVKQKAIIANLKEENGFRRKLIMLAFERCAKADIPEEVEEWCLDHMADFVYPDSEADSDAMTEPYFSHSDDDDIPSEEEEEESIKMDEDTLIEPPQMEIEPEVHKKSAKVRITKWIAVDENHPDVIELHNTGFDLDLCIEAVTHYPDDISRAVGYVNDRSDQGKLFKTSLTAHGMGLKESTAVYSKELEIIKIDTSAKSYLPLSELGMVLQQLSETCKSKRNDMKSHTRLIYVVLLSLQIQYCREELSQKDSMLVNIIYW